MLTCKDCGHDHYVFSDGSSLCPLCYVNGPEKARRIVRKRQLAQVLRNNDPSALRRAFS